MNSSNPKHIGSLIKSRQIKVKKRFGQNFLIDDNILNKIIDVSQIDDKSFVIEIGSGVGSLTERIIPKAKHLLAYEIDNDLIPLLEANFKADMFHLIHDDILKRNIDSDIEMIDPTANDVVVIANLPYYITTPILMQCLETSTRITKMVVMMQYEVAKRITAHKNTKDYNALSLAVQYRAHAKLAFKVPKNVFIPAPNVDSAVVVLDFHHDYAKEVIDETFFFEFIKGAFKQRRKTLLNNIHAFLPNKEKESIIKDLEHLNINPQVRADNLSLQQFITLANYYKEL